MTKRRRPSTDANNTEERETRIDEMLARARRLRDEADALKSDAAKLIRDAKKARRASRKK
jgi:hypothetical protein